MKNGGMDNDLFDIYQRRKVITQVEVELLIDVIQQTRDIARDLYRRSQEGEAVEDGSDGYQLALGADEPLHRQGLPLVQV